MQGCRGRSVRNKEVVIPNLEEFRPVVIGVLNFDAYETTAAWLETEPYTKEQFLKLAMIASYRRVLDRITISTSELSNWLLIAVIVVLGLVLSLAMRHRKSD